VLKCRATDCFEFFVLVYLSLKKIQYRLHCWWPTSCE